MDIIGKKFGKLTVLKFLGFIKTKSIYECLCDCGNIKIVKRNSLVSEHTKSCGCLEKGRKMTESDLIINADRNTKKEKIQLPKRKQECCKCHKTFTTELDKRGIPYNRICPKCREENTKVRFGGSKPIFGSAQSRNTGGYNE